MFETVGCVASAAFDLSFVTFAPATLTLHACANYAYQPCAPHNNKPCAVQVLAVSETLGSQATNFLNVYKIAFDSASAVLMYGPLTVAAGAMGSPGGNGAGVHLMT